MSTRPHGTTLYRRDCVEFSVMGLAREGLLRPWGERGGVCEVLGGPLRETVRWMPCRTVMDGCEGKVQLTWPWEQTVEVESVSALGKNAKFWLFRCSDCGRRARFMVRPARGIRDAFARWSCMRCHKVGEASRRVERDLHQEVLLHLEQHRAESHELLEKARAWFEEWKLEGSRP